MQLCALEQAQKSGSTAVRDHPTLKEIPLQHVVGSVGRAQNYTRSFLPLRRNDEARWVCVRLASENEGLPPIEVYQLGEDYYVLDRHHRVSVLKRMGASYTEAYVTKISQPQLE